VIKKDSGFINKIIAYCGKIDLNINKLIKTSNLPKFFIAMGSLDDVYPSYCNDSFIKEVRNLGCEVEFILHSKGEHGFEVFNEGEETNRIIEQTIKFIGQ
jgi:acetyl esterase/lipase